MAEKDDAKTIVGPIRHVQSPESEEIVESEEKQFVPVIENESDDDYDTDLEEESKRAEKYGVDGKKVYLKVCEDLNIIPCSPFLRQLDNEDINISHYNVGPVGCEAIAIALMKNTNVLTLNISDNSIGGEGAVYLSKLLTENCIISGLDISQNALGTQGAYAVGELLRDNTDLVELNVSSNSFKEKDFEPFVEALRENFTLKILNLSCNSFDSVAGLLMGPAIQDNVGLEVLDLSWNNIRGRGAEVIGESLRQNCSLKMLDLSWNGFGDEGVKSLCEALMVNDTLEELDLTSNRITVRGARDLVKMLSVNNTLQVLRLGKNPFRWNVALEMVKAAVGNAEGQAREFYFDDMPVIKEFEDALDEIIFSCSELMVQCGTRLRGKDRTKKTKKKRVSFCFNFVNFWLTFTYVEWSAITSVEFIINYSFRYQDLLNLLLEYIEMRGMRMYDMFKMLDRDNNNYVTHDEIMAGLKRTGLPMTNDEVRRLITLLDENDDGAISYKEFSKIRKTKVFNDFHARNKKLKTTDAVLKRKISYMKK